MRYGLTVVLCLSAALAAACSAQTKPATPKKPEKPKHVNRLAKETSPYLLSHKHNPVDWYPWGKEALEAAKQQGKPIFLSIGYSACHWCHVMERESFESEEIAKVMNEHFINIKVDREERPDIDQIYMTAVQAMTGSGGWPMSVWMTPDLKPFYGGTYFPPKAGRGRPGFLDLLEGLAKAWKDQREVIDNKSDQMASYLRRALASRHEPGKLEQDFVALAAAQSAKRWDREAGGFAQAPRFAPKFPHAAELTVLLIRHARSGDEDALKCAEQTLVAMRRGGMYDQIGGGFHRYSTDRKWLVPHFEKMLYDNALLVQTYLDAAIHTGKAEYTAVARETLDYMRREMQDPAGGFYSATDADSEGVEGKFFVWQKPEVEKLLGDDSALFCAAFGVTTEGNWHEMPGHTVLSVVVPVPDLAKKFSLTEAVVEERLQRAKKILYEVRQKRVPPLCDDKILTAWNGMAITAMTVGYKVTGEVEYLHAARRAADFILTNLREPNGRLFRTWRKGEAKLAAYLDDYAYMADALLHLFEADFDPRWLAASRGFLEVIEKHFRDPKDRNFFFTADDGEALIVRSKTVEESSIPSGAAMATLAFLRAGLLLENSEFVALAEGALEANHVYLAKYPTAVMTMVQAVDLLKSDPREVVIAGDLDADNTREFLSGLRRRFPIEHVVTVIHDGNRAALAKLVPGHAEKGQKDGVPTAYVCKFGVCDAPVTDPARLQFR